MFNGSADFFRMKTSFLMISHFLVVGITVPILAIAKGEPPSMNNSASRVGEHKMVFLHGGPGYHDYLERFFKPSFPNGIFFTQERGEKVTIEDVLSQVDAKIGEHKQVVLVGHSWGGILALEYLRQYGVEGISGLILIDAPVRWEQITSDFQAELAKIENPTIYDIYLSDDERKEGKRLIDELEASKIPSPLIEKRLEGFDLEAVLKGLAIPVLNIFGESDIRVPARTLFPYVDFGAHVENFSIENSGHYPFLLESNRGSLIQRTKDWFLKALAPWFVDFHQLLSINT